MTTLETRPPKIGIGLAVVFGLVVVLTTAGVLPSLAVSLFGLLFLVTGILREIGSLVTIGAGSLVIAILIAGLTGTSPVLLLIATAATVLAWDVGIQAIDLAMLGRDAETTRPLVVHSAASTAIAATVSGLGYAIYHIVSGGQPVTALVLLLFGALVLIGLLR